MAAIPPSGPGGAPTWTRATLVAAVLDRLGGTNAWASATEVQQYLLEALRTYQIFTGAVRERLTVAVPNNTPFTALPITATLTDADLTTDLVYALIEDPLNPWVGTGQFTAAGVEAVIEQRRDQLLREVGTYLTRTLSAAVTPDADGRVTLPASVLAVQRLAWVMANGQVFPLQRGNPWEIAAYARGSLAAGSAVDPTDPNYAVWPIAFSVSEAPPFTVQLAPAPLSQGQYDLLAVAIGPALTTVSVPTALGVPNDWGWVIKWGVLADLLAQDGPGQDLARASYCAARWQESITLLRAFTYARQVQLNGALVQPSALGDRDQYQRSWQSPRAGAGASTGLALAGVNYLSPAPQWAVNTNQTVVIDWVTTMPVPAADADPIQIDQGTADALIDYIVHLALFKEGAAAVNGSLDRYQRFRTACGLTRAFDWALSTAQHAIEDQTRQQGLVQPLAAQTSPLAVPDALTGAVLPQPGGPAGGA